MKFRSLIVTACTLALLVGGALIAEEAAKSEKPVNTKCPMSGKDVDATKTVTYTKVIGFCCNDCKGNFAKNPEKHLAKIAKIKGGIVNKTCPVSGKAIDESKTVTYNGNKVAFCCGNCQGKFEKDPAALAGKIKYEVASNSKCLMSGEEIDASKVVVYKKVVGFCCGNCKAKFEKDPDATIEKVK